MAGSEQRRAAGQAAQAPQQSGQDAERAAEKLRAAEQALKTVVRFMRATEPGRTGFIEQEVPLAEVKPGWIVSAATRHEGEGEMAEQVKIIVER